MFCGRRHCERLRHDKDDVVGVMSCSRPIRIEFLRLAVHQTPAALGLSRGHTRLQAKHHIAVSSLVAMHHKKKRGRREHADEDDT